MSTDASGCPPDETPGSQAGDDAPRAAALPPDPGSPGERRPSWGVKLALVGLLLLITALQVTFAIRRSLDTPARAATTPVAAAATAPATGPLAAITGLPAETQARRESGYRLYREKGCARCHGDAGQGGAEGPALREKYLERQPAQVASAIHSGRDDSHQRLGSQEEALDIATFVNCMK